MDAAEQLSRYCINDRRLLTEGDASSDGVLDARTDALVRIALLIAAHAPGASFHAALDDAVAAGASLDQIVAVLDASRTVVGLPRTVAAAQRILAALGLDEDLADVR